MKKIESVVLRDLWLKRYHNTSTEEIIKNHPREYCESPNWFRDYKVTKEQYEEWCKEAKALIKKVTKCSNKYLEDQFPWIDLSIGPSIIKE